MVTPEIIESLGGIQNTIKPLEKSLLAHELRPIEYMIDYKQTLQDLRHHREPMISSNAFRDPQMLAQSSKLLSASPFRATIKLESVEKVDVHSSDADEFERDTMSYKDRSRKDSPIKDDSELMRT
jgi:RecA-family ATPase